MREDWVECTLNDVCYKITDGSHNPPKKQSIGLPMLSARNIENNKIVFDDYRLISESEFIQEDKRTDVSVNDILLTIVATIGRSAVVKSLKSKFTLQRSVAVLGTKINPYYLNYQLQGPIIQSFFINNAKGTAQKGVYLKTLSTTPIILPTFPEQRVIVKKIEALFSSLDAGIADLKKAQNQLKIYRQAILKKAFEGEGEYYNICDVTKDIFAGGDKPARFSENKNSDFSVPIYANAVANKGLYGYTDLARVNQAAVTIAGRGSGTGHVELRDHPYLPIVRLINVIPKEDILDVKYLFYYLKAQNIRGTGSAIPQLTIPTVKEYLVFLPSLEQQAQIVKEIESRLSVCDAVEQQIKDSLSQAEALRQSILKKAFEGRLLTEAEITACKQEPDYEPASVLLEKITAEKEANKLVKKTKKK